MNKESHKQKLRILYNYGIINSISCFTIKITDKSSVVLAHGLTGFIEEAQNVSVTLAISVFDLMHRNESVSDYDKDTQGFKDIVQNILNDNNYEISIKTVKTTNDNTTLRLKHVNSDYSPSYKDAVVVDNSPVVLSHGMHSNLFTWNDFATKLAESGRDSWLIEMYGGPTTDSDCKPTGNYYCPNYTFTDLKTYYWPALVAGVQQYSGKNNLSYVGYDLGCTVALESLEMYESGKNNAGYYFDTATGDYVFMDLSNKPINTFVGLGCLGNFTTKFDNESNFVYFVDLINITDYSNSSYIAAQNYFHIPAYYYKLSDFAGSALTEEGLTNFLKDVKILSKQAAKQLQKYSYVATFLSITLLLQDNYLPAFSDDRISFSLYQDIQSWMRSDTELNPGQNVNISNVLIIQSIYPSENKGTGIFIVVPYEYELNDKDTDGFVHKNDIKQICKNINGTNRKYYVQFEDIPHFGVGTVKGLYNQKDVEQLIISYVSKNSVENSNVYSILSTQNNCES